MKQKGIIAWFTYNTVAANLLMFLIIIGGLASVFMMEKQVFPNFEINNFQIQVAYPGAAPQEVEQGILMPIEEALQGLDGIKKVRSSANESFGSVTIEVSSGFELQDVMDEAKMRVDAIRTFPQQIEEPQIFQMRFDNPVLRIQVYGDVSEKELKELAKDFRSELTALPGVGRAELSATRSYEISIEVSDPVLQKYQLTFDQVAQAVRNSSLDLPGGSIKASDGNILLRTKGQAYLGQEFSQIVLRTHSDGTRLTLGDVATIKDDFEERQGFSNFNGQQTVMLNIFTAEGENDMEVSKHVNQFIAKKNEELPTSVRLAAWADRSFYLKDRLNLMLKNMLFGGLLVFFVLALFLKLRLAFWVLVGMMVSFLGALLTMPFVNDLSLNMLTLFGFILVLGIVVDDAIIIGESSYSEIEQSGQSKESVIVGAKRVAMPATFGVLTTIVAFIPMVSIGGMMGAFWGSIGWVVILCLAFSLIESKWILPAHLGEMSVSKDDPHSKNPLVRTRMWVTAHLSTFIHHKYKPFLTKAIEYRYITLSCFFAIFLIAIGFIAGGFARWEFFPKLPGDFVQAQITMENGTPSQETNRAVRQVSEALERLNQRLEQNGGGAVKHYFSGAFSETTGMVIVELTKAETRDVNGFELVDMWREEVGSVVGAKVVNFNQMMGGPQQGKPIAFQLRSKSLQELRLAAESLKEKLASYEGVYDIEDSFSGGNKEIIVDMTPKGEALGFNLADVARQVRQAFYGAEAQRLLRDTEEVKVMVRYPLSSRQSIKDLQQMHLRTPQGAPVPFAEIASIRFAQGYASISRIDQTRAITVSADVQSETTQAFQVVKEIREDFFPTLKSQYPGIGFALEGASQEESDSIVNLLAAAVAALFGIYALMAIPLKSYTQPFIIMSVIPYGFIGALVGHLILGLNFSILSMFGLVALTGVVVNDSLIMVDFVNKARQKGMEIQDAAIHSGTERFRAIVLTSATTFFGLLPIVLEKSLQAQIVIPMAISLAFGILFSTVITLILIPSLYLILDDIKCWIKSTEDEKKQKVTPSIESNTSQI